MSHAQSALRSIPAVYAVVDLGNLKFLDNELVLPIIKNFALSFVHGDETVSHYGAFRTDEDENVKINELQARSYQRWVYGSYA